MTQKLSQEISAADIDRPDLYINRELSWIEFNRRVFEEAKNSRHPLLERVKFVSIFETNLDEFIMIRQAGLKDQMESRKTLRSPDGRTPEQQLTAVRQRLAPLLQEVRQYWRYELVPLLAEQHIYVLDYEQLDEEQRKAVSGYFEKEIYPVLTPLAVDPGHPFPHISNRSLNLAVVFKDTEMGGWHQEKQPLFARVKVPLSTGTLPTRTLPRFVRVPTSSENEGTVAFVWIEQVIAANLHLLFPGLEIWESYPFRVLRDADIELQEDEAPDLLEYIEQEVRERRFGAVIDLAVNPSMPPSIRNLLIKNLEITDKDLTIVDGPLGMGDVMELYELERPDLKDPPFTPRVAIPLRRREDLFAAIQKRDVLLHHPYDGFNSVIDFIRAAADDPDVLTIKQTLYRVGVRAPVVQSLLKAVENGKQVAVLVELKARFDEENNITWARELENAGVHVVYGLEGLKTHAKLAMVIRREEDGLHRYFHLGTGNYNASTAKIYEDLGLLTDQQDIGEDVARLFNALTGYAKKHSYQKLLVAPTGIRRGLLERIEHEIEQHKRYGNGRLIFKCNALTDPAIINMLYRASQAGVQIDLIIRGICSLRPGIAGISENIRVRSIVGRFLEHSRVYCFGNNGLTCIYLGSADLMERNLDSRVEVLFPIDSPLLREAIVERMLQPILADTVNAHELRADGMYVRVRPQPGEQPFDSQDWFISHPLFEMEEEIKEDTSADPTISAIPSSA
jgi:polyphosphate kinase